MRKAICGLALLGLLLATAGGVRGQTPDVSEKDPAIALGFAMLCPGCGHLYSGETVKGAAIAAISIGSVATGFVIQMARMTAPIRECDLIANAGSCQIRAAHPDLTPILVGGAIGLASYLYGLIDAGPSARRMNAANDGAFGAVRVRSRRAPDGSIRTEFGIRLTTGW